MKKRSIALVCLMSILVMMMTGCGARKDNSSKYEIALVTATGSIDDKSFNQGSWKGVTKYAKEKNITYKYYKSTGQSDEEIANAIKLAIKGGANSVVCPGYFFEVPLYTLQEEYKDVKFIMLDSAPKDGDGNEKVADNVAAILYAEEQAGFLAGYAAVKDGYRALGFMGGVPLPSVVRYGYGFVDGAEYAAKELGLKKNDVTVKYTYVGNFDASPDNMAKASAWYSEGTEVIFACGGSVGNSVMKAASTAGKKVIGVDVDQSAESDTIITSAVKNISKSVYDALTDYYNGSLVTGQSMTYNVSTESVILPMETSKFTSFTDEDYKKIYQLLLENKITIATNDTAEKATDLKLDLVKVTVTK